MDQIIIRDKRDIDYVIEARVNDSRTIQPKFAINRYVDGVDLSTLAWSIAINAPGATAGTINTDTYVPTDKTVEGNYITFSWLVINGIATQRVGTVTYQIHGVGTSGTNNLYWKSGYGTMIVSENITATPTAAEQQALSSLQQLIIYVDGKLDDVIEAGENAQEAADYANEVAESLEDGTLVADVLKADSEFKAAVKGEKGDSGDDGYSPTVSITNIPGGHRITITDSTGPHTADVMDGSSEVTRQSIVSALSTGSPNLSDNNYSNAEKAKAHIHDNKTIIDLITSQIKSGWDSASSWVVQNGTNVLNHLSDSVKHITASERSTWNAKSDFSGSYTDLTNKPSIPSVSVSDSGTATDEVQYITIDGVEKKLAGGGGGGTSDFDQLTNRPKYNGSVMTHETNIPEVKTATWDGKYAKPADGIPSTDMTSAVQTSLGKADSALQSVKTINNQSITGSGNLNVPMGGDIIQDEDESNCGVVVSGTLANVDATLSISGAAADAAVTGDEIELLKRKYVLFETITLAEDMASITRTTEDSTFFDCSRLYVGIATASGSANGTINVAANYGNNLISQFKHDDAIKTSTRYMHCEFMNEFGIWGARGVNGAAGEGYKVNIQLQVRSTAKMDTNVPYINKLVITSGTEGVLIPANTVINIYGVKV